MAVILTSDQMRSVECGAIRSGSVSGLELMERAAEAAAEEIGDRFAGAAGPRRAVALCGPGNNGGDGFAIAAILARRGWDVSLWAFGEPTAQSAEAAEMRSRWSAIGGIGELDRFSRSDCGGGPVIIDSMFGTGLGRPIGGGALRALRIGMESGPVVAVDILSGLSADTGEFMCDESFNPAPARWTVTFQTAKPGHFLREGGVLSGDVAVRSIGLESEVARLSASQRPCRRFEGTDISADRLLKRDPAGHKYRNGHVLVLSGASGRGGAARLAARAALRIGAGLVTIGVEPAGIAEHASQLNAIMLRPVDCPESLAEVLSDRRINCICAGPGLGLDGNSRRLVGALLRSGRHLVLDADALTMFAGRQDELFDGLGGNVVLTPHAGEFRQLFPDLHDRIHGGGTGGSKVEATLLAARRSNATILHKGHDTVVANPDGGAFVVAATGRDSAPWLATAGSGDVLAGMVSGLMARGWGPTEAACAAAWLHFAAARRFGPGLIAEDLPETIPAVLAGFGTGHAGLS